MLLNIKPEPADLDRIERLLTFANMDIQSQQQVFDLWSEDPNVLRVQQPDGTVQPYLAGRGLPDETFLEPFLHDQHEIKNALADLADGLDIGGLLDEVQGKLRDKLHGMLTVSLARGRLNLGVEPVLDGVEACMWYAVALLFHYGMDSFVRRCRYEQDGRACGRFFLDKFRRRNYCELKGHAELGKKQAVLRAIRTWQRGEGPRMGSRKALPGPPSRDETRQIFRALEKLFADGKEHQPAQLAARIRSFVRPEVAMAAWRELKRKPSKGSLSNKVWLGYQNIALMAIQSKVARGELEQTEYGFEGGRSMGKKGQSKKRRKR